MPKAFDSCVSGGGRVRRKSLKDGKYINICFRGGKSYAGHIKDKETPSQKALKQK